MMKNVLFINPPTNGNRKISRNIDCSSESKGEYLLHPYDFILLSGVFSKLCNVQFVDFLGIDTSNNRIIDTIKNHSPNIVIIAMADVTWSEDLEFLKYVRGSFELLKIFVFGDSFFEDHNVNKVKKYVDGVIVDPIILDVEQIISDNITDFSIIDGLRDNSFYSNINNSRNELSLIPVPKHELFLNNRYKWPFARNRKYATVNISTGCPFNCIYCGVSNHPFRYREYSNVIEELDYVKGLGVNEIYFADKSFGIPKSNTLELLKKMVENRYGFSWSTYMHPNSFNFDLLDQMKLAGCHTIIIGIETYNFKYLEQFKRHVSLDSVMNMITYAHQIGLEICGDFLLGLPDESKVDVEKTIKMSCELNLDFASYNIVAPLAGTSIKKEAIASKRMSADDHHFDSLGKGRVLKTNKISAEDLLKLRNKAVRSFYLRPSYLLSRVIKIKGPIHLWIQLKEMGSMLIKLICSGVNVEE